MSEDIYQKYITTCLSCVSTCNHCAISCLEEKEVQSLTKCIRLNLECAVICQVTAELVSLDSQYIQEIAALCSTVCNACAEECDKHAGREMQYCKECVERCRMCAKEANEISQYVKEQFKGTRVSGFVPQEECDVISRAAGILMSMESAYAERMTELNMAICNAAAENAERLMNMEIKVSRERALLSDKAHRDLKSQDQKKTESNSDISKNSEQSPLRNKMVDHNNKHSSALLASSLRRSLINRLHANRQRLEKIQNPFWTSYS
jgi:hypothetical protein